MPYFWADESLASTLGAARTAAFMYFSVLGSFFLFFFFFPIACLVLHLKIAFFKKPDLVFLTEVAEELGRAASSSSVVPYLPRLPLLPSKTRTLKKQGENKENLDGGLDASESLASSSAPGRRGQNRKCMPEKPGAMMGFGPTLPVWAALSI